MQNVLLRKGLVLGIILLFVGADFIIILNMSVKSLKVDLITSLIGYRIYNESNRNIANDFSGNEKTIHAACNINGDGIINYLNESFFITYYGESY